MNKNRLIFYGIFAFFHLFILIFSLYMDSHKNDLSFLFEMQKNIWMIKYGSMVGVVLLIVDFFWVRKDEKKLEAEKKALEHELNTLKAKLFDMQEADKKNYPQKG